MKIKLSRETEVLRGSIIVELEAINTNALIIGTDTNENLRIVLRQ